MATGAPNRQQGDGINCTSLMNKQTLKVDQYLFHQPLICAHVEDQREHLCVDFFLAYHYLNNNTVE